jgi:hypothetical protein
MPNQFEEINEQAAEAAVKLVHIAAPTQDPEAVANGGRVVSELFGRTLDRFGIELPDAFSENFAAEVAAASLHDIHTTAEHRRLVAEMESGGV